MAAVGQVQGECNDKREYGPCKRAAKVPLIE
jgi:hypothetical protein